MKLLRLLLFPFSLLYHAITFVRNKLYDLGFFRSIRFPFPVIVVGNLSTGGTGKTPHIEYLISLLKNQYKLAVISRGYKRKSKGFYLVEKHSNATCVGDEPLQLKKKFPNVLVAVDEKRACGIQKTTQLHQETNVVLLDDAFQHRSVTPSFSILLTDYDHLYTSDFTLPTGNLREPISGAKRADVIIVTKCSPQITQEQKRNTIDKLKPQLHQQVFFSFIQYGKWISLNNISSSVDSNTSIFLFTGIANNESLIKYLKENFKEVIIKIFSDHHSFTSNEIKTLKKEFDQINTENKIMLTTEKDSVRLTNVMIEKYLKDTPLFYVPIQIDFDPVVDKKLFDELLLDHVKRI